MRRYRVWIISPKDIRDAVAGHGEWGASLKSWRKITKNADWKNVEDVKRSWKNVDKVGSCVVFDIQHNQCRLIARIFHEAHRVYILRIIGHPGIDAEQVEKWLPFWKKLFLRSTR